jgi:hypothetical protein
MIGSPGAAGPHAREFDQISAEDRRDWQADRFVEWLRDEWRATA